MSKKNIKPTKELLKEALVPAEEQPYKVPENWLWVRLGSYLENHDNLRIPISSDERKDRNGIFPYYGASGVIDYIDGFTHEGEFILLGEDGANLITRTKPIAFIANGKIWVNNHAHVLKTRGEFPNKFVVYYLNSISLNKYVSGSAQPKLNQKNMNTIPLPIPPLNEQKRIADKVERLLDKINQAKQLIEEAKETFELRRAAILDKAFRGELTKKWREDNVSHTHGDLLLSEIGELKNQRYSYECDLAGKLGEKKPKKFKEIKLQKKIPNTELPESWTLCSLGDIVYDFSYGTSSKSNYSYEGVPVLRIPNIGNNNIELEDIKYLTETEVDNSNTVVEGDILIIRSNGSKDLVGKCAIVDSKCSGYAFASYLIRIRTIGVVPEYVYYMLKSERIRSQFFTKARSSAGINNINTEELSSTTIPLPPYDEQIEIVNKIKELLYVEEKALDRINLNNSFDSITSALLLKAFRGELGTNDPVENNELFSLM
jgi:type I restriction enzyme, S subunit